MKDEKNIDEVPVVNDAIKEKVSENIIEKAEEKIVEDIIEEAEEKVAKNTTEEVEGKTAENITGKTEESISDVAEYTVVEGSTALSPYIIHYEDSSKEMHTKKRKGLKNIALMTCVVSILGGLSIGVGLGISMPIAQSVIDSRAGNTNNSLYSMTQQDLIFSSSMQPLSMVDAVNTVKPSVVSISTTSSMFGGNRSSRFVEPFDLQIPSSGTGIIFDESDDRVYIVTNEHVIENANSISIAIGRSEEVPAKLLGRDVQSDLAVIYVLKSDLEEIGIKEVTLAKFGDSAEMQVGEVVIAIGNALGQGNTTTMGIVSAKNIQIPIDGRLLTVLQTDAAINPGNSGGPLINSRGEVIGINTVKLAKDNVQGMGYSITSNIAIPIMEELRNQTPRPYLGIRGHNVTPEIAALFDLEPEGVFVHSVYEGSGAYAADLRPTDIITHFNGQLVPNMPRLSELIQEQEVGDEVSLTIIRDGLETIELTTTLTGF